MLFRSSISPLSNFKTGNALPYIMAALYATEHRLDDCLILNTHNRVCDSIHSNVFLVKGMKLITPPVNEGCVDGIMRQQILRLAFQNKLTCSIKPILPDDVIEADEIFLTNVVKGIQWVSQLEDKTFNPLLTKELFGQLTEGV